MGKYFVFDLDGTLLNDNKVISDTDIQTINTISENNSFILASGRHIDEITPYSNVFNHRPKYIVCCDGVYIYNSNNQKVFESELLSVEDLNFIRRFVNDKDILIVCENGNRLLKESFFNKVKHLIRKDSELRFYNFDNPEKIEKIRVLSKMVSKELLATLENRFSSHFVFGKYLDLKHKDVSKYNAILKICDLEKASVDDIVYFGDDMNDIECFCNLPYCVAMENSCDDIKKRAYFVSKSNNEDGVSFGIRRFL